MAALTIHPVPAAPAPARRRRHLELVRPGFTPMAPVRGVARPEAVEPVAEEADRRRARARPVPLRLTGRGRRLLAVLAFLGACVLAVTAGGLLASAGQQRPEATVTVTVEPGQSLWSLAAAAAAPGEDVREVIQQIVAINDLSHSELQAGQRLEVPQG